MSGFKPYPAYKDSGVEWLGVVPEHWEVGSLRRLIKSVGNGTTADQVDEADDTVAVSRIETISAGQINFEKVGHVGPQDVARRFLLNAGDILFSHINSLSMVGNVAIYSGGRPLLHGMNLLRIQPLSSISSEWLLYWLKSKNVRQEVESRAKPAINQASISTDSVRALPALIPLSSEQTQIARFLDHETARIDALIEEQQRLIELLKEKRQAVISHAVTKGLDPTVPMKTPGVEWLGEVPAHWDVCSARRVIRAIEQGWSPECEANPADEDAWGVLKAGCVNRGVFDPSENKTLPVWLEPITEYEVRAGDILMSRASGSPELVGSTALLGEVRERLMLSDKIFRIHLEEKVSSSFFVWVMNAQFMRTQIEQALSGGNGMANNLPQSSLLAFWLAVPPDHEQGAIAEHINEMVGEMNELISEGSSAVSLLQERRSALISAAVTGKIDVRGWQPPARAQAPECEEVEAV